MAIDYDAWLEEPYQRACREEEAWERAEEEWLDSDDYQQSLAEWLEENPNKTEADFQESKTYENGIESIIESWSRYHDEW